MGQEEMISFTEITNYEKLKSNFSFQFATANLEQEMNLFWEKWIQLHLSFIHNLKNSFDNQANENELAKLSSSFMSKRQRVISAFLQGIKKKPSYKTCIANLKLALLEHDEFFKKILNDILQKLKVELLQVRSYRKVSNAYLNTPFFTRG